MTRLNDYNHFAGRHWETGSVHNHFAYRGIKMPHSGAAPSEALLLGISGGIVFGYFSFAYEGYDPMVALLSRNTFDPWDKMLSRLGIVQNIKQTSKAEKGRKNLIDLLDEGLPPIVWADFFLLDYNVQPLDEGMWGAFPLVVYGYDQENDLVEIADRSKIGLQTSAELFDRARGRTKKEKFRLMTLDPPDMNKLKGAVQAGIGETLALFTEKPPKGSKNNFGFNGYQHWIKLLTKPKDKKSWHNVFPRGPELYAGLTSAYDRIVNFGQSGCGADRHTYAAFLDEAAVIMERPALKEVAAQFRTAAGAWCDMANILLPDHIEPLKETRQLKDEQLRLFLDEGHAAIPKIEGILADMKRIKEMAGADYPLSPEEVDRHLQQIAAQVQVIHDMELEAVEALREAMI